jgi:hypothetical protein
MLALLLLLSACAHVAPHFDVDALPVLPSPRGDLYARVPGTPRDPLVASVAGGLPWDEALSGVAASVALAEVAGQPVDLCQLRWMAVLAGYPYPLVARSSAAVPLGQVPQALVAEAQAQRGKQVDVGLVRARGGETDHWVLLVGEHHAEIPPVARDVSVGDTVPLGGAVDWVVSDPLGDHRSVEGELHPDLAGEWMLSARVDGTPVATFPLYVGVSPPEVPPMRCDAHDGGLVDRAGATVAAVRAAYGYTPMEHDSGLDSVARARLRDFAAGHPLPDAAVQLRSAGYLGVPVAGAECKASTVEACLEKVWWSPEGRGALVGDLDAYGVAVQDTGAGVLLVLLGAG